MATTDLESDRPAGIVPLPTLDIVSLQYAMGDGLVWGPKALVVPEDPMSGGLPLVVVADRSIVAENGSALFRGTERFWNRAGQAELERSGPLSLPRMPCQAARRT